MTLRSFARHAGSDDGPGPGSYSIQPDFGNGPRVTIGSTKYSHNLTFEPHYRSLSSTFQSRNIHFGARHSEKPSDRTPSPALAHSPMLSSITEIKILPRIDRKTEDAPGPCEYSIPRKFGGARRTILCSKRTEIINNVVSAPPGEYEIPSQFSKHHQISIGNQVPIPTQPIFSPGPIYNPVKPIGSDCASIMFPKANMDEKEKDAVPSPDSYSIPEQTPPPIFLKGRPKLPETDKRDYPYENIGGTFAPKQLSIGIKNPNKFDTITPGPIYMIKPPIPHKIVIGERPTHKAPKSTGPSPCEYFKEGYNPPKKNEFPLFYGPLTREPPEIEENTWKLPPGYYYREKSPVKPSKVSTFGSRNFESYSVDIDPPFPDIPSTLGGPSFTIGEKVP